MKKDPEEQKQVTFRDAANYGCQMAINLNNQLHDDNIPASEWPKKFPFTIKEIKSLPHIGSIKIAKKAIEAAKIIWNDIREEALELEKDMLLHPEEYYNPHQEEDIFIWRALSMEIEQAIGGLFVTEFIDELSAKENIHSLISPKQLKKYIIDFEDDYKSFIDEVREIIRAKKNIKAEEKLDLICLLNINTLAAKKLLEKSKRNRLATSTT